MSGQAHQAQLEALLRHPSLWRGRGAAALESFSTGFAALDAALPGGGWPRQGLIEIITTGSGHGELTLWNPLIRYLTHGESPRCCAFIAPPFELFAPAWRAAGVRLDRLLVARAAEPLWALEQALQSGVCAMAFAWPERAGMTALRRLALAAARGAALGVLIRPLRALATPTAATLRLLARRTATHLRLELLKGRGIAPRSIELALP
ncbi:MAG TPA: translesion DNA synthesis-associated protein ImuA [Steroidobacteraceae bacterium]|nr:translesion DNA synthesis-associated protein ImuA [Steroidobacteraceae bacterium]